MQVDIVTIFPEMFAPVLNASILSRAQAQKLAQIQIHNLRTYTADKRRTVDDRPYGGGPGMVMKPEPIFDAIEAIEARYHDGDRAGTVPAGEGVSATEGLLTDRAGRSLPARESRDRKDRGTCRIVLMAPQGERLTQAIAQELSALSHLVLLCGHYEGVDERVRQVLVDQEISIGDYVLTGGELPAMVLIDSVVRLIPGVLGHQAATHEESFVDGLLEYPHYTRPPMFRGMSVPEVLRSGDHRDVTRWRKLQAMARTLTRRPDLLQLDAQNTGGSDSRQGVVRQPNRPRHRATASGRGPVSCTSPNRRAGCRPMRGVIFGATGSARGAPHHKNVVRRREQRRLS